MARRSIVFFCLISCMAVYAADTRPRILSFANQNWLAMSIGEYKPGKGWVQSTDFYDPPQPGDPITIFGTKGKLGEVLIDDKRRPSPTGTPLGWSAHVKRGTTIKQPFALAIHGSWPDDASPSRELPLNDPESLRIVSDFLNQRGLKVVDPYLTQAYQVDLDGDGRPEMLICAHSDLTALRDDQAGIVYAVALLSTGQTGHEKTIALASQTTYKPIHMTVDEHEHHHGKRDFYRLLAFHDINGDGRKEIVLYRAKDGATVIDVFTFDGHKTRKVLSAFKHNYN